MVVTEQCQYFDTLTTGGVHVEIEESRGPESPGPKPRFPELDAKIEEGVLVAVRSREGRSCWYKAIGWDDQEALAIQQRLWHMNRTRLASSCCRIQSRCIGRVVEFRAILRSKRGMGGNRR